MSLAALKSKLKTHLFSRSQWLMMATRRCCGLFSWFRSRDINTYILTYLKYTTCGTKKDLQAHSATYNWFVLVIVVDANRSTTASHICRTLERVSHASATETATFATTWRESVWTVRATRRDSTASSVSRAGTALPRLRTVLVRFPLLLCSAVCYKTRLKPNPLYDVQYKIVQILTNSLVNYHIEYARKTKKSEH